MAIFTEQRPGVSSVGQYQMSGQPFATSSFVVPANGQPPVEISFPHVTQWVYVQNNGSVGVKVGFSSQGTTGSDAGGDATNNYFFAIPSDAAYQLPILRVRVKSLFLVSEEAATTDVAVVAGLTGIVSELRGTDGPNYSGSLGVG